MAFGKFLVAAASATALITSPAMAAASQAPIAADARDAETATDESELFGSDRRGGILALILIAAAIAIGVYIVLDDEEDEEPASP